LSLGLARPFFVLLLFLVLAVVGCGVLWLVYLVMSLVLAGLLTSCVGLVTALLLLLLIVLVMIRVVNLLMGVVVVVEVLYYYL